MNSQTLLVTILMLLATLTHSESRPIPNCPTNCGNLTIPYPFGLTSECSLDDPFLITCDQSYNPPKPFLKQGNTEVLGISLNGEMKVASPVSSECYDNSGSQINSTISAMNLSKFSISSRRNKFTAIGCDTYALLQSSEGWHKTRAGCISWCNGLETVRDGDCSGIGCCQSSIPDGVKDFLVNIRSLGNHSGAQSFNPCGYAFVVETDAFEFSTLDLKNLRNRKFVPVVLDWSVGNLSCKEAQKNVCIAANSECVDSRGGGGYRCRCSTGFQGNPYLVDGCRGARSFSKGQSRQPALFVISSVFMVPAIGGSWVIWRRKQKKVEKLRRSLFIRNGGELLEAMQSIQKTLSIFTAEDLKKATNDYDANNVLSQDNFGITYKGILPGVSRLATIKSCNAFDHCNIEVLISKLVTLSQINHKNVVKLLGCCLETQVPLVVYEFITVKSLSDYLVDDRMVRSLSWDVRLRIAADVAGVIVYMHSAASVPIVHGSLDSSSVLLHHGYTVKVLGFASMCLECSCVQMYGHTADRLTEKSDVYGFGIILAELITGKDVMSPEMVKREDNISRYFIGSSGGAELNTIFDDRLATDDHLEQLTGVAEIAKLCLLSSSEERPTMKEVAIALEFIIFRDSRASSTRNRATKKLSIL